MRRTSPPKPRCLRRRDSRRHTGGRSLNSIGRATKLYLGLAVFSIAGSGISAFAHVNPGAIAPIASCATLLAGAWATLKPYLANGGTWPSVLFVLILGTGVELIGVATGLPFGPYRYSDRWIPVIHLPGVGWFPLLVPIAWLLMVSASTFTAWRFFGSRWPIAIPAIIASLLATGVDLVMEPTMTRSLNYWQWTPPGPLPGGAAILNPLGWFLTALIASAVLLSRFDRDGELSLDSTFVLGGHIVLTLAIGALGSAR